VGNLHGAQNDDQKNAQKREEKSPGTFGAINAACFTHTIQLYRRMRGWVDERAQGCLVEDRDVERLRLL